jgi:hypothetical protein
MSSHSFLNQGGIKPALYRPAAMLRMLSHTAEQERHHTCCLQQIDERCYKRMQENRMVCREPTVPESSGTVRNHENAESCAGRLLHTVSCSLVWLQNTSSQTYLK